MAKKGKGNSNALLLKYGSYLLVTLATVAGLLALFAFLFEGKISQLVLDELRKRLKSELLVEQAEISMFRNFPRASIILRGVELGDKKGKKLLEAERIDLKCGLFGLLTGYYNFQSLAVYDARFSLSRDSSGRGNYEVFSDASSQDIGDVQLGIQQLDIRSSRLLFVDDYLGNSIDCELAELSFGGNVSKQNYPLKIYLSGLFKELLFADMRIENKEFSITSNGLMQEGSYQSESITLNVLGNIFRGKGSCALGDSALLLDLNFRGELILLAKLIRLLPKELYQSIIGLESRSEMPMSFSINGAYGKEQVPEYRLALETGSGGWEHPHIGRLSGLNASIEFSNANPRKIPELKFENFRGQLSGEDFSLDFTMQGWQDPYIKAELSAHFNLKYSYGIFGSAVQAGEGYLAAEKLAIEGFLSELNTLDEEQGAKVSGVLKSEDIALEINNNSYALPKGQIELRGNTLIFQNWELQSKESLFSFQAQLRNLLPYLLGKRESKLRFRALIRSGELALDEWSGLFLAQDSSSLQLRPWLAQLEGEALLDLSSLRIGKFTLEAIHAELQCRAGRLHIPKASAKGFGGDIELRSSAQLQGRNTQLEFFAQGSGIDFQKLLESGQDFSQQIFTSQQIREAQGDLMLYGKIDLNEDLTLQEDGLFLMGDIASSKGHLLNVELFRPLEEQFGLAGLIDLHYSNLYSRFSISGSDFRLVQFYASSPNANLSLALEKEAEAAVLYWLKCNGTALMRQRLLQGFPELETYKAKRPDEYNAYFSLRGTKKAFGRKEVEQGLLASQLGRSRALHGQFQQAKQRLNVGDDYFLLPQIQEPEHWGNLQQASFEEEAED